MSPPPPGCDAIREHAEQGIEILTAEIPIGICPSTEVQQLVLPPVPRGDRGDELLRQDVERHGWHVNPVEHARTDCPDQSRALDELVARARKQAAFRNRSDPVPSSREAVATTTRGCPRLRRSSADSRICRERLP